ncbi:glucose-1-phosphate cytidylyltransferase [Desulfovibrio caledoniensis]
MEVVILCGGLGTRLREETEFRPKPMVNIGERPILWHIMKVYAHYGHDNFILPLGYKGEMIRDYFVNYQWMNNDVTINLGNPESLCRHNDHDESDWTITLCNTGQKTLKGGRIKRIQKYIKGDTFMLTYGDGVADINIPELIAFHKSHGKMATISGVSPSQQFGEVSTVGDRVTSFAEKPAHSKRGRINGGFFVLNREVFDILTEDENCDFEYGPLEEITRAGELMLYQHDGFWACMDTLRDTEHLNRLWDQGKAKWKVW